MKISILTIGNELLSGDTINTNVAWIGRKMTELGCLVSQQRTVPDEEEAILKNLKQMCNESPDYLILTGGLGPTSDDITRDTIFKFVNTDSYFDEDYWLALSERFKVYGTDIPESNRGQAMSPNSGELIENPKGSARGFKFIVKKTNLIVLPGVPEEMKSMMNQTVIPEISTLISEPRAVRTLRTTGVPESILIEKIEPITSRDHGCQLGYYPSVYGVDIRINGHSNNQVDDLYKHLSTELDTIAYGEGKQLLEEVVIKKANSKRMTISIAESCTGGLIGHRLTEVPDSSKVFKGGMIVYSNEAKIQLLDINKSILDSHGAVSKETAGGMAENVMRKFNTDYGVSITGIAGPSGGTKEKPVGLVYIGMATRNNIEVKRCTFGSNRKNNKLRTSQVALNWLRLSI